MPPLPLLCQHHLLIVTGVTRGYRRDRCIPASSGCACGGSLLVWRFSAVVGGHASVGWRLPLGVPLRCSSPALDPTAGPSVHTSGSQPGRGRPGQASSVNYPSVGKSVATETCRWPGGSRDSAAVPTPVVPWSRPMRIGPSQMLRTQVLMADGSTVGLLWELLKSSPRIPRDEAAKSSPFWGCFIPF